MKATLAVGLVALLALASAQTSVNAGGICPGCASNSDLLWVGTLNTQQIPTASRYRDQRLRATVDFINTDPLVANFDAMCLQELWAPSRKNFVTSGVNQRFPYSYTTSSFEVSDCDFNCTSGISNLDNCFSDDCFNSVSDIFSDNAWNCLSDTCSDAFDNLDINCQICVTSQDNSNMKAGMQSCRSATSNLINTAGTCTYLFGGESDNVLLSAHPLIETNYLLFSNSPYVASTVIHGKFQKGTSTVNMFCTHLLPANISPGNFESVNKAQVQQLIQFVNNNTAPGEFVVIAGDFNNGPELANIDGEWENNFRLMESNGFQSTFVALANPPTCSYCANGGNYLASNPVGPKDNRDILIDHVFIRNGSACAASTGLFATQNIVDVGNRNVPLSDHYGVFSAYCLGSTASPAPTVAPSGVPTIAPTVVPTASPIIIAPSPGAQEGAAGIVTPVLAAVGVLAAIILYS